jgi:hypothetical protein
MHFSPLYVIGRNCAVDATTGSIQMFISCLYSIEAGIFSLYDVCEIRPYCIWDCNGPKYIKFLFRIITNVFIDYVEFRIIIQGILILKCRACAIYCVALRTILATKV